MRRIFGPKRDENGEWRRLQNEVEEGRSAFKILTGKPTGSPRGMRMGSGEGSTMRNFIVCTVHLI